VDGDHPQVHRPACYDAQAQVLWYALAPELWRRTTIALHRALGCLTGLQERELRGLVRISYAKVAEFQRRGAIHFDAVIRLDAATNCRCPVCLAPPPGGFPRVVNSRVRDECLNINMFWSLAQARVVISDWKEDYNHRRRHSALGYPAPAVYAAACNHQ
jgi:hypothetical protein